MTLRLLQPPATPDAPLVLLYHYSGGEKTKAAAPGAAIATETGTQAQYNTLGPDGIASVADAIAQVGQLAQMPGYAPSLLVLGGWSAGCQAVRTHLRAGVMPDAVLACDGTHSAIPPTAAQIDPWKAYAEGAKAGRGAFLASCSSIDPPGFASTRATLRLITGFALDAFGTPEDPAITRDGQCIVYACSGDDAAAHIAQAEVLLPRMLGEALSGQFSPGGGKGASGAAWAVLGALAGFFGFRLVRRRR